MLWTYFINWVIKIILSPFYGLLFFLLLSGCLELLACYTRAGSRGGHAALEWHPEVTKYCKSRNGFYIYFEMQLCYLHILNPKTKHIFRICFNCMWLFFLKEKNLVPESKGTLSFDDLYDSQYLSVHLSMPQSLKKGGVRADWCADKQPHSLP